MYLDNYTKNTNHLQLLNPKISSSEQDKTRNSPEYLISEEEAISVTESQYSRVSDVWVNKDTYKLKTIDNYNKYDIYEFYFSGWKKNKTGRFYKNYKDMVSVLQNNSSTKKTNLLKKPAIQKIIQNCTYSYLIEGKDLHYPMNHLQHFFNVDTRKRNIDYLKNFFVGEFFFKFEVTVNNFPHLHIVPENTLNSEIMEFLKIKSNPKKMEDEKGGTQGYLGYLLKPVWFDKEHNPRSDVIRNLQIFLGNYLRSGFETGKKITSNYGVQHGLDEVLSLKKIRIKYLNRRKVKKSRKS
jgi:hypothetical protein